MGYSKPKQIIKLAIIDYVKHNDYLLFTHNNKLMLQNDGLCRGFFQGISTKMLQYWLRFNSFAP